MSSSSKVSTRRGPSATEQDDGSNELGATVANYMKDHLRRGSPVYNTILQATQWQRDNYLMGQQYADKRQREREIRPNRVFLPRIGYGVRVDPNGMGLVQLSNLGASFIPSPTVKQALMPIVLQQPTTSLYQPALRGMVSLIDSQQANADMLVRQSVLDILEQERLKKLVMQSTKGYIADNSTGSSSSSSTVTEQESVR
ncbi:expressed unknown protein [Seminavis robusta]|uniref:Uncharacterized protein n=1 Tax=Seminavis robusta TaxID=568900 RepID=A0A9N8HMF2_9STRA|nr:expressed unknown protein [Seminavis robusta]|eukprot:Sro1112_g242510.1 n/a (199) ;mRNA; f:17637-18233